MSIEAESTTCSDDVPVCSADSICAAAMLGPDSANVNANNNANTLFDIKITPFHVRHSSYVQYNILLLFIIIVKES